MSKVNYQTSTTLRDFVFQPAKYSIYFESDLSKKKIVIENSLGKMIFRIDRKREII